MRTSHLVSATPSRHLLTAVVGALALTSLAACSSPSSPTAGKISSPRPPAMSPGAMSPGMPMASESPTSAPVGPATVEIRTFAFLPKSLTVAAGTKVTFINRDDILHTVTSGTRDADAMGQPVNVKPDGKFNLMLAHPGAQGSFTFTTPGTYHYYCDRHPGMDAVVVVT